MRRSGNYACRPKTSRKSSRSPWNLLVSPALIPAEVKGIWPDDKRASCPVFDLPALSGSWEQCVEGLYDPYEREKMRPFVFDHALAKGRDDVVLVHLNHRLVQMGLRLLAGRGLVRRRPQAAAPGHGAGGP